MAALPPGLSDSLRLPDCIVCSEEPTTIAFGSNCNHSSLSSPICGTCALRLTFVFDKQKCPLCSQQLSLLLLVPASNQPLLLALAAAHDRRSDQPAPNHQPSQSTNKGKGRKGNKKGGGGRSGGGGGGGGGGDDDEYGDGADASSTRRLAAEWTPAVGTSGTYLVTLASQGRFAFSPNKLRRVLVAEADLTNPALVDILGRLSLRCPLSAAYPGCSHYGKDRCTDTRNFASKVALTKHVAAEHKSWRLCRLCLEKRGCLPGEHLLMRPKELASHTASGHRGNAAKHLDECIGGTSPQPPADGHPACEFCKGRRFFSTDELFVHMRDSHFSCTICDSSSLYYANVDQLAAHLTKAHRRCPRPACANRMLEAFADDHALEEHLATVHGEARTLGSLPGDAAPQRSRTERERDVLTAIREALSSQAFSEFKSMSGAFRLGNLTPDDYVQFCRGLFSSALRAARTNHVSATVEHWLTELADLLPDQAQRDDLSDAIAGVPVGTTRRSRAREQAAAARSAFAGAPSSSSSSRRTNVQGGWAARVGGSSVPNSRGAAGREAFPSLRDAVRR